MGFVVPINSTLVLALEISLLLGSKVYPSKLGVNVQMPVKPVNAYFPPFVVTVVVLLPPVTKIFTPSIPSPFPSTTLPEAV
jgi:hypothetical protein